MVVVSLEDNGDDSGTLDDDSLLTTRLLLSLSLSSIALFSNWVVGVRGGAALDIGYTTAIWGRIKCARLSAGSGRGAVVDVLLVLRSETKPDGGSVHVAPDGEFPLELGLFPPKSFPKLPIVIREKRPLGGGGGFFRMLLPGIGMVTEDVDALRTGGGG